MSVENKIKIKGARVHNLKSVDVEFAKDLLDTHFVVPSIETVHVSHSKLDFVAICRVVGMSFYKIFVASNCFDYIIVGRKASLAYCHARLEVGVLRKTTDTDVAAVGDSTTILRFSTDE